MIHPHTELRFINDEIGFGVFATKFIPKGTITWALDELDQILEPSLVSVLDNERKKDVLKYSFRNQLGQYVLCWDIGKYVNHSSNANCMGTAYDIELAIRDIYPNEQLTDDYGTLNIEEPFECFPEVGTTRNVIMPDDLLTYYKEWDQDVFDSIQFFHKVNQPLLHLVRSEFLEKINAVLAGIRKLDSIRNLYYDRKQGDGSGASS